MLKHPLVPPPPPGELGQQPVSLKEEQAAQPALAPPQALKYGYLVNVAYNAYATGSLNPPQSFYKNQANFPAGFTVIANIQMTPTFLGTSYPEYFGFLAFNANTNQAILVYRGSLSTIDWVYDMDWFLSAFPSVGGYVATGFLDMYNTMTVTAPAATDAANAATPAPMIWEDKTLLPGSISGIGDVDLSALSAAGSAVFAGHSLGSALITLQAGQVSSNPKQGKPVVYTFASPRVGDTDFANAYNAVVNTNYRIYNWPDIVPRFPKDPLDNYQHVKGGYEVDSLYYDVKDSLDCFHSIYTYCYLVGAPISFLNGCYSSWVADSEDSAAATSSTE